MYKIGMLCKHFKGNDLTEKNIYRIISLNVNGKEIDQTKITYTGDKTLETAENLVVYENIFQEDKIFTREYDDISSELSDEDKIKYSQKYRVQPLTEEEIKEISNEDFIKEKKRIY